MRYTLRAGVPAPGPDDTPAGKVRAAILALLDGKQLTGEQIADELDRPLGTVMWHLRSLTLHQLLEELPDEEAPLKDL